MNSTENNCEQFEPLVSAMIDGELAAEELVSVQQHLNECSSCKQLHVDFVGVNEAVDALSSNSVKSNCDQLTETFVVTREKPSLKNWLSVWRLAPLAGVATLLIGLFIVTIQPPSDANADQLVDEFVKPMTELNQINIQQQRDQNLMMRTIEMDLRTLKLELKQMENTSPEERTRIENQIESMLQRVQAFDTSAQ